MNYDLFQRDAILARHFENHREILTALRQELKGMYVREHRPVSASDARKILDRWKVEPGNWLGATFQQTEWQCVGMIHSSTPGRHGNRVFQWIWKETA